MTQMLAPPVNASSPAMLPRIRSALFDIAAREPEHAPRWTLRVISALLGLLVVWTIFARLDIVAVAEGRLVPQTYVKIVQPTDAGIVREILVREGDAVTQGQVLVRLDPTESSADSTATARELAIQQLQVRRVDAELSGTTIKRRAEDDKLLLAQAEAQRAAHAQAYQEGAAQRQAALDRASRELTAAREELTKLEQTLPSYERSAAAYEKLASEKLMGQLQAEEKRRDAMEKNQELAAQRATVASLESAVEEERRNLAQFTSSYSSDLHTARLDAVRRISELEQQQTKLVFKQQNLELRAPQDGVVKELATTTVGAVVQPGTVLVSLVPREEPLRAEVSIQNQDIGFVKPGQTVRLKLATYPFQKYGLMEGTVKTVIADAGTQEKTPSDDDQESSASQMSFKAIIELAAQHLQIDGGALPLAAGMQLTAEIIEDDRTVLEYLLSPVQRIASEAGRER